MTKDKENVVYRRDQYNKTNETEQWIRLSDGCHRGCWNCYCPKDKLHYPIPEIVRNKVVILDMNFFYAYPDPVGTLERLGGIKVNKRVVYYGFLCGLDFTLFTKERVEALKKARCGYFNNKRRWTNGLRIAWDRGIDEKDKMIKALSLMKEIGYKQNQVFMLSNGKVSFEECVEKLKVLKDLRTTICDCWYDNQIRGSVEPIYWTDKECKLFGQLCRAHNVAIMQRQYDAMDFLYKESL